MLEKENEWKSLQRNSQEIFQVNSNEVHFDWKGNNDLRIRLRHEFALFNIKTKMLWAEKVLVTSYQLSVTSIPGYTGVGVYTATFSKSLGICNQQNSCLYIWQIVSIACVIWSFIMYFKYIYKTV